MKNELGEANGFSSSAKAAEAQANESSEQQITALDEQLAAARKEIERHVALEEQFHALNVQCDKERKEHRLVKVDLNKIKADLTASSQTIKVLNAELYEFKVARNNEASAKEQLKAERDRLNSELDRGQ